MTSQELAAALRLSSENRERLAEGRREAAVDTVYASETWMRACVAAIGEAPGWLRRQADELDGETSIPNLIADSKGTQARAVFLAQSAACAAAGAWAGGDATACLQYARRAARWWSAVEGLSYKPPAIPVSPLATLDDSLETERASHDPRAWAPVEDMVLAAAAGSTSGRPAGHSSDTQTWIQEPAKTIPAKLVLESVAEGQPGLWRAYQAGLTVTDEAFLAALQDAWTWATTRGGLDAHASVRWRLLGANDERALLGNGDAIGLACAVGLHQLSVRHQRVHRIDRKTSFLAAISPDGTLKKPEYQVSPEEREYLRYLVAAKTHPAPPAQLAVRHAGSVKDAVTLGRRPVKVFYAKMAAAICALAVLVTGAGVTAVQSGQSDSRNAAAASAHARQAEAVSLANAAQAAISSDPPRAIAAAAAAYKLAPGDPAVMDAAIAAAGSDPRALRYLDPAAPVRRLSLSSSGQLLAALLGNGRIEIWNLAKTPPALVRIQQLPGTTSAIAFLGGGNSLVTAGTEISILNPLTGAFRRLGEDKPGVSALSASTTRETFVTSSPTGIRLWNSVTGASRVLSGTGVGVVSLAPDDRTLLAGDTSGTLRLLTAAGGVTASTRLPSPVTSVLLAPSGTAYAMTAGGRLYCLNARLRPVRSSIALPPDVVLSLRPATSVRQLTPNGSALTRRPAEILLTASNAALLEADDPASITTGTGSSISLNHIGVPIRGLGMAALVTDGSGRLAATVLADGQIRVSSIDFANGPALQANDIASGAVIDRSTLALTSGLLSASSYVALVNRVTGQVNSHASFSHAGNGILMRPVITAHAIADTGATTSSLDVWRIHEDRLVAVARNMRVAATPVSGMAADDGAGLLFVATGTHVEMRRLFTPAQQLAQASTRGRIFCLTADPAHRTIYACTSRGIVAVSYSSGGRLGNPRTVDAVLAQGLDTGSGNEILILLPDGDATLLPHGFGMSRRDSITLSINDPYTFSSALTPPAAVIGGRNSEVLLYSTTSGSQLDDIQLGGEEFATALWPDGNGVIGGATFDGSLFTLPSVLPSNAIRYECALLANPKGEWQDDFGRISAATQLPATGGC